MKYISKMLLPFLAVSLVVLLFIVKSGPSMAQDDKKPSTEQVKVDSIPKDMFPEGCVSCHINTGKPNEDYRLSTIIPVLHPKHPKLSAIKSVPEDCKKCHTEGKKFGKLSEITHKAHFRNDKENYYLKEFKGLCTNCHSIDNKGWRMKPKTGNKNW
jgi:hypothetical protein